MVVLVVAAEVAVQQVAHKQVVLVSVVKDSQVDHLLLVLVTAWVLAAAVHLP
jgi:hypothetical protein